MSVFLGAFVMIFFAEMGDKSQFLAFNLTSRYKASIVLLGIFIATVVNNGIAIYIGTVFAKMINMDIITLVSSLVFLAFGVWILFEKIGNESEENINNAPVKNNLRALISIITLFSVAEIGDKTQIASAVYAATYNEPLITLAGVVLGMLLADSIGIYAGYKLSCSISKSKLKIISSIVFLVLAGINFMTSALIPSSFILILLLIYILIIILYFRFRT